MESRDQVSLITGASRGIGRATAVALAAAGARVVLGGRDETALAETARLVEGAGGEAWVRPLDVTSTESTRDAVKELHEAWGRIDHLVNNAGLSRDRLLMRSRPGDWEVVIDTNLSGVYRVTREVLPIMVKARSGRIVNLASVIGQIGNVGQTAYGASKAGIIGFTKSLAREVAGRGVTVNCVAPGFIETDMTRAMPEQAREELLGRIPLGRAGTPEEVAEIICFLLSEEASYVTGAVLRVNGGLYM
jgi:3-oxoacyl-[acyl-carrier protein] reductase